MAYMSKKYQKNMLFHKFYELAVNMFSGFYETNSKHSSSYDSDNEHELEENDSIPKEDEIPLYRHDEGYWNKVIEVMTELEKERQKEMRAPVRK